MQRSYQEPQVELSHVRESRLIVLTRNRERNAFEELERRYRPQILKQLRRLCHNGSEADDILQDVLVTIYLKLSTFEGKSSLSTWIYRITLNAFLMHERKQRRGQLFFVEEPFTTSVRTTVQDTEAETFAYASLVNNEFHLSLARAVSELPKAYQEVFLMRNKEDLTTKEVSKRLGISVPAVKSRNHRARKFLKSRLESYYYN